MEMDRGLCLRSVIAQEALHVQTHGCRRQSPKKNCVLLRPLLLRQVSKTRGVVELPSRASCTAMRKCRCHARKRR